MLEEVVRKEKCTFCFSSFAYLYDFCPVCRDTGFVEVKKLQQEDSRDLTLERRNGSEPVLERL